VLTGVELEDVRDKRQQRLIMLATKPPFEYPYSPQVVALGVDQLRGHREQISRSCETPKRGTLGSTGRHSASLRTRLTISASN